MNQDLVAGKIKRCKTYTLLSALRLMMCSAPAMTQTGSGTTTTTQAKDRDGQHDFDFELGNWKIHLKRRERAAT